VFEELEPGTYLTIFGTAAVATSAAGYSGTLDGWFQVSSWDGALVYRPGAECRSSNHRLAFER
jgi:hypothetical protein